MPIPGAEGIQFTIACSQIQGIDSCGRERELLFGSQVDARLFTFKGRIKVRPEVAMRVQFVKGPRAAFLVCLLALSSVSSARGESMDEMGEETVAESLSVENEVVDADIFAMEEITKDNREETARLKKEIVKLERDLKASRSAAERAKRATELTYKRLEVQQRLKGDAEGRLAKANTEKERADRRLTDLRAKVRSLEERTATLTAKNRETKDAVRSLEKEQADLTRRMKKVEVRIAAEKERQKKLRAEQGRLSRATNKMKSQVARLEERAARPL